MIRLPFHVRRELRKALPRMLARIPQAEQAQFKRSAISAVSIFLDVHRPTGVQHDLRRLADSVKNPRSNPGLVWSQISQYAKEVVCQYDGVMGDLAHPSQVADSEFREELRRRLFLGERWSHEKRQRRHASRIVGTRSRGRPRRQDVDVLVALLAAAYARAKGSTPTKSWSLEDSPTDFELILRLVFRSIGLNDRPSTVKSALDRHQHMVHNP